MSLSHDAQTVLDATKLPPRVRDTIIEGYRRLAEANRELGHADIVAHCERRIALLSSESRIDWGDA